MPTTPVSPERRIVLSDAIRRDVMMPRKFSDEILDFEVDWTAVCSGDDVSEVEVSVGGGLGGIENSPADYLTRIRVSGGSSTYAVGTIDLLAITDDGERIGARLKVPLTFRASAPGPITRLLSGALSASSGFTGSMTVSEAGEVSLVGGIAATSSLSAAMTVVTQIALAGTVAGSSTFAGTMSVDEVVPPSEVTQSMMVTAPCWCARCASDSASLCAPVEVSACTKASTL